MAAEATSARFYPGSTMFFTSCLTARPTSFHKLLLKPNLYKSVIDQLTPRPFLFPFTCITGNSVSSASIPPLPKRRPHLCCLLQVPVGSLATSSQVTQHLKPKKRVHGWDSYVHPFPFPNLKWETFLCKPFICWILIFILLSMSDQHIFPGISSLEHPGRQGCSQASLWAA